MKSGNISTPCQRHLYHCKSCPKRSKVSGLTILALYMSCNEIFFSGVLVECDPSIKAIILKIDQDKHDYIVEDLDDQTLVIKENQLASLKARLEEVCRSCVRSKCYLLAVLLIWSVGTRQHPADA